MQIHELSASELSARLGAGELSSREVVAALLARRADIDPRVRAFCAEQPALAAAEAADRARQDGGPCGPLAGLPVTIKENIAVAGTDATLGIRKNRGQPSATDAVMVAALRKQGAVVLGKTNVPQLLLAQETENAIYGVTNNPWNLERVPGGSSGGEAAAIAAGMSPLGLGTDIGGSIRIPAHFCGVVGFKPTLDRWSNRGSRTALPGQELVRSQLGAMARSTADIAMLWRALDPRELAAGDPLVSPLPAADPAQVDVRGLRIGWFDDDPFLEPASSLRRAVERARRALEDAGATLVRHRPVASEEIVFLWLGGLAADGGRTMDRALAGEPPSPQLKASRALLGVPGLARQALGVVAKQLGERRAARLLATIGEKRVDEVWALAARRTELRLQEFDAWAREELDAVICPPHVVPALRHRESGDFTLSVASEFRWTLLNFPAGVVPVTRATAAEVGRYPTQGDRIEKKLAAIDAASAGLPVGVQVVARPFCEHVLLAVMGAIEASVARDDGYPRTPVSV
jgi:fatty acid amide hydrolase